MADGVPMLRREQRRHLLMNGWLIAGFVIVGTAVTNERGIFRPLGFNGALSATARAFIAIASPAGLNGLDAPRLRDVRSVSSLAPFEVTAPSRDLRRRLIDAMDWEEGDGDGTQEPLSIGSGGGTGPSAPLTLAQVNPSDLPPAFPTPPSTLGPSTPNMPDQRTQEILPPDSAVPEPGTWALLIAGFGLIGGVLRAVDRRRRGIAEPVRRRRKAQPAKV